MKEIGIINRELARVISEQGHHDMLMVCDAGFATPKDVEVIDISLTENKPTVVEILQELKKFYSVEKLIMANQTLDTNPSYYDKIREVFNVEVENVDHKELKEISGSVKAIVRSGDFTAYANVILVSGAGDRWYLESAVKENK